MLSLIVVLAVANSVTTLFYVLIIAKLSIKNIYNRIKYAKKKKNSKQLVKEIKKIVSSINVGQEDDLNSAEDIKDVKLEK